MPFFVLVEDCFGGEKGTPTEVGLINARKILDIRLKVGNMGLTIAD